jgi:hypothetical protein
MKRWHEEIAHYRRQCKTDARWGRSRPLGCYRKRHALDCGNPHCGVCHNDKFPKRGLSDQEVRANVSWKEQMKDFKKEKDDIRERNSDATGDT